jgi:hypothetical protein
MSHEFEPDPAGYQRLEKGTHSVAPAYQKATGPAQGWGSASTKGRDVILAKKRFVALAASTALLVPIAGAAPAGATEQNGLVNVYAQNIASGNRITVLTQVPISVAANFCNINVNVLAVQLQKNQFANCTAKSNATTKAWVAYR